MTRAPQINFNVLLTRQVLDLAQHLAATSFSTYDSNAIKWSIAILWFSPRLLVEVSANITSVPLCVVVMVPSLTGSSNTLKQRPMCFLIRNSEVGTALEVLETNPHGSKMRVGRLAACSWLMTHEVGIVVAPTGQSMVHLSLTQQRILWLLTKTSLDSTV